jgi:hypothetical protein
MSTTKQPSPYTAYLLRCWLEGSAWRYSLEEVGSGKRHGFATLDEFVSFMLTKSILPGDGLKTPGDKVDLAETKHKTVVAK